MSAEIPIISKICDNPTNCLDKTDTTISSRSQTPINITATKLSRSVSTPSPQQQQQQQEKQQKFAITPLPASASASESTPANFSHHAMTTTTTTTTGDLKKSQHSHTVVARGGGDTKDSFNADVVHDVEQFDRNGDGDEDDGDINVNNLSGVNDVVGVGTGAGAVADANEGNGEVEDDGEAEGGTTDDGSHDRQQNQQQEFCLRWNNYQTNLTSVFEHLLQNEFFVDVTLACDDQSIKAHKMVLSACSPYFQELFVDNPCHHPIVIMRDIKWTEMKSIVDFMYKGEINVSQEQIGPLLRIAETLKIRGLADVGSERPEVNIGGIDKADNNDGDNGDSGSGNSIDNIRDIISKGRKLISARNEEPEVAVKKSKISSTRDWNVDINIAPTIHNIRSNSSQRNRWPIGDSAITRTDSPITMGCGTPSPCMSGHNMSSRNTPTNNRIETPSPVLPILPPMPSTTPGLQHHQQHSIQQNSHQQTPATSNSLSSPFTMGPSSIPSIGIPPPSMAMSHADDAEIRPGIAEMIREEERAKLMETSQSWMTQTNPSIADSYQYQLQSWWQKCWSTNHNLMTNLRFRERGPLKSWRPETMAEAIISVLKESLSLSQAAKKYDIPYPTFVLYANRVHNMLGPSMDGGTDLRPKGRGRPQRILLGMWPDEHIRSVIKTIVFRDVKELKEDGLPLQYGSNSPVFPFQDSSGVLNYPGMPCPNGLQANPTGPHNDAMSPEATAAAVAAVAHGIRQQIQMAAAAQHHPDANPNVFNLSSHLQGHPGGLELSNQNSASLFSNQSGQRHTSPSVSGIGLSNLNLPTLDITGPIANSNILPGHSNNNNSSHSSSRDGGLFIGSCNQETLSNVYIPQRTLSNMSSANQPSPIGSVHDLRMNSPDDQNSFNSPVDIIQPAVNLAVGVSGMAYKTSRVGFTSSPHPDHHHHLFQEDITDLVSGSNSSYRKRPMNINNFKEPSTNIEIEPISNDCRSD